MAVNFTKGTVGSLHTLCLSLSLSLSLFLFLSLSHKPSKQNSHCVNYVNT